MQQAEGRSTDVLIIGAGPFGLSLAAYLSSLGVDHLVVGETMGFWKRQMPTGMLLRSGIDWHLDAEDEATIEAFLKARGVDQAAASPLSRDMYLDYVEWFQQIKAIEPLDFKVGLLEAGPNGGFRAIGGGQTIEARAVVVAVGFRDFSCVPEEVSSLLPESSFGHTCDVVDFARFPGRSVVIVGGRQSAFEWAALLAEAGAERVHLVYRHDTPRFEPSDWSWVEKLMERTEVEPLWYRKLDDGKREELGRRFWGEGRLKLEPWLARRIERPEVRLWPRNSIAASRQRDDGVLAVTLDSRDEVTADFVIFATGYKVDLARIPFLGPDVMSRLRLGDGAPVLGADLQSSVPGLYFTSMAATRDFGPFFAFTVSARCSSRLIGDSLASRASTS